MMKFSFYMHLIWKCRIYSGYRSMDVFVRSFKWKISLFFIWKLAKYTLLLIRKGKPVSCTTTLIGGTK